VLEPDSPPTQVAKPSDPLTENEAPATRALVPTAGIVATPGAAPPATAQGQQAALSPISKSPQDSSSAVRGVTDSEIRFGISAPFTGPAKELGQNMKIGIEAAFNLANAKGGVYGRQLRLIAADDGYEPTRTLMAMKELDERDQVFGLVGNVGTPTRWIARCCFSEHSPAPLLRNDPPHRYVFNYRASYAEETAAVVNYLVKVRGFLPEQIAVFAQQDAYGDAGFAGVAKAIRSQRQPNFAAQLSAQHHRCR
jgi:branched-chain amino acid transport system substrate-binding protein